MYMQFDITNTVHFLNIYINVSLSLHQKQEPYAELKKKNFTVKDCVEKGISERRLFVSPLY